MNIALPATPSLWSPLHAWLRRLVPEHLFTLRETPAFARQPELLSTHPARLRATALRQPGLQSSRLVQRRPLRVVRFLEVGQSSAQVGRMVISGRMADVCAELDRLAASEATWH